MFVGQAPQHTEMKGGGPHATAGKGEAEFQRLLCADIRLAHR
ncbi:hypothetical protein NK6_4844 [Bradyrhizobium diazoefficiens]|uniref:Uncharacterized protein n=1 Tax=Bradyrhizobium diazoefficiens TaxID=1355477 RepID=A0A0E4FYN5_9BRAD|nr:hypothetical protein NK6_4844 [Bradyrhizobium diazoefficiens]